MELLPIGPVLFIDTAGIDDTGALGALRARRTRQTIRRTDVALLVADGGGWGPFERELLAEFRAQGIPVVAVFSKTDLQPPSAESLRELAAAGLPSVAVAAPRGLGLDDLKAALIRVLPEDFLAAPPIAADLVPPGELAVLVTPIDKQAPRGRLILPQVQTIRDLLDHDAYCIVVKENALRAALERLRRPPALVVTDSQAFRAVAADTPAEIPLTSFSILWARLKGDLCAFVQGAAAIDRLRPGDRVLVGEACAHHPIDEDIGRVKIPAWLAQRVGGPLSFTHVQGHDFPEDLSPYRLAIHCGACTFNRRHLLSRIVECRRAGVPITNYGLTIAHCLGILDRALAPFPAARELWRRLREAAPAAPASAGS